MRAGVQPQDIFPYPIETVYSRLAELGVRSSVHQDAAFTPSPHGAIAFKGADVVPFPNFSEGLSALSERILADREPTYHFLYFSGIDNVGHQYGPNSPQFDAAVDTTMRQIERFLSRVLPSSRGKTLFLMTADHGQTETNPNTTFYIDREIPGFGQFIKTNRKGQLMVPGGSCRDLFLYIKESAEAEVHEELARRLKDRAEVYMVRDLIKGHFFGEGEPSSSLPRPRKQHGCTTL